MDMYVPVVEYAVVDAQSVDVCLYIFEGYHSRLFHHVAEVTGECQLASLALAERSLDEEYLATYAGPCQSGHYTGVVIALIDIAIERRFAEQVLNLVWSNLLIWQLSVECLAISQFAQRLVRLFFELPHTTLACILFDDFLYGSLVERRLVFLGSQSAVVNLARNEVALGYLYLLLGDISAHLNQFHTVEQRLWYAAEVVGCSDEEYLREVKVNVKIVVVEGVVLFGVEHFEQC